LPHLWPTGSSSGWPPSITARYFSSCPSDSTSRWTPCPPGISSGGFRSALFCFRLSPSCPFRPLHTFLSSRPARNYPRFWIQRSSSERRRDFNPPDQRAAQRTLWASRTPSRLRAISAIRPYTPGLYPTRLPGRASPVPRCSFPTCHRLRPRGGPASVPIQDAVCCLHRDMSGSALPNTFRLTI